MAGHPRNFQPRDAPPRQPEFKIRGAASRQYDDTRDPPHGPATSHREHYTDRRELDYDDRRRDYDARPPHRSSYDERSRHRSQYDDRPAPHDRHYHERDRDHRPGRYQEYRDDRRSYRDRDYDRRYDRDGQDRHNDRSRNDRTYYDDRHNRYDNRQQHSDVHLTYEDMDEPSHRRRSPSPHRAEPSGRRGSDKSHERNRSASPRRPAFDRAEMPPSREVRLDNLPPKISENELQAQLQEQYGVAALEDVRVIRDRETRDCRGFGFITFPTVDDATNFIEQCGPGIYIYDSFDNHGKVKPQYTKERDPAEKQVPGQDWHCSVCDYANFSSRDRCRSCSALRPDAEATMHSTSAPDPALNRGDHDAIDSPPSTFLIFRDLPAHVTEEMLAKSAFKLFKDPNQDLREEALKKGHQVVSSALLMQEGARPNCIRRVFIARSKFTRASLGFGFVEFEHARDASAALARFRSLKDFTVASKTVLADYIHSGVFVPVALYSDNHAVPDEYTFASSVNPTMKLHYWDRKVYITTFNVPDFDPQPVEPAPARKAAEPKATKKRKIAQEPAIAETDAVPLFKAWQKSHAQIHGKQIPNFRSSNNADQMTSDNLQGKDGPAEHGSDDESLSDTESEKSFDSAASWIPDLTKPSEEHERDDDEYFAMMPRKPPRCYSVPDEDRTGCLVCMRGFDSPEERQLHEQSEKHRANLKDELKLGRGLARLKKRGLLKVEWIYKDFLDTLPDPGEFHIARWRAQGRVTCSARKYNKRVRRVQIRQGIIPPDANKHKRSHKAARKGGLKINENEVSTPQPTPLNYQGFSLTRDRAAERRAEEAADKKAEEARKLKASEGATTGGPRSKGASMLAGMGWKEGAGLGANAQGMSEPIEARSYQPGVGLGAWGGDKGDAVEEAARNTARNPSSSFVDKTREAARERYYKM